MATTRTATEYVVDELNDRYFQASLYCRILVAIPAFVGNAIFLYLLHHVTIWHANARLLLANIVVLSLIKSLYAICKCTYALLLTSELTNQRPSSMPTGYWCILMESLIHVPYYAQILTFLAFAFERFYATHKHATYHSLTTTRFGVSALILIYLIAIMLKISVLAISVVEDTLSGKGNNSSTNLTNFNKPITHRLIRPQSRFCIALYFTNSIQLLSAGAMVLFIVLLACILYCNIYRTSSQLLDNFDNRQLYTSLSSRIQFRHNIELTRGILPCAMIHLLKSIVVMATANILLYFFYRPLYHNRILVSIIIQYLGYLPMNIFDLINPLLFVYNSTQMRKEWLMLLIKCRLVREDSALPIVDEYSSFNAIRSKKYSKSSLQKRLLFENYHENQLKNSSSQEMEVRFDSLTTAWNKAAEESIKRRSSDCTYSA